MLNEQWKRYKRMAILVLSGSVLYQVTGCTQTAVAIGAYASLVTAGGVLYLIRKVLD